MTIPDTLAEIRQCINGDRTDPTIQEAARWLAALDGAALALNDGMRFANTVLAAEKDHDYATNEPAQGISSHPLLCALAEDLGRPTGRGADASPTSDCCGAALMFSVE